MTKNIPAILLKNIVLLPNNTLKLEFDNRKNDNNVIDMSLLFHDGYILVASDYMDKINDIAVLSKIENKIELPNGNTRVDIKTLRRVKIVKFLNLGMKEEPLESIFSEIENISIPANEEKTIINKLIKELKNYSKSIPYVSNSIINLISNEKSLDKLVDITVPNLNSTNEHMLLYLNTLSPVDRSKLLLSDIYADKEMFDIEKNLDAKVKKELDSTQKEYFLREKMKLIKEELGDSKTRDNEVDLLKRKVYNLKCSKQIKNKLLNEINRYESFPINSPEVSVVKDYIDTLISLPFNKYTKDNLNLTSAKKILDNSHYGLDLVKTRIIEYLAVLKNTNGKAGTILCLVGPPGVGKTTLAKVIAECLNRKFCKISVNGMTDEAELIGHRRTYVGAYPGRIISEIKKQGSMNPVILIDEVDKIGNTYKDISNVLLNILDKEQNKNFVDSYIEEEFDLSSAIFILTANDLSNIKEPLKDRLEIIEISGYTDFEKVDIVKKYLFKRVLKDNGLKDSFIKITDDAIKKIINDYTKEAGVRELYRLLDKIVRKIVTQTIINDNKIDEIINNDSVFKYLGKELYNNQNTYEDEIGVVNGLAYTVYGGDILPIEVNYYKGTGNLILTGSLGDIIKESATIALSYIKSNYKKFNIKYETLTNNDIHIHIPEGAIKKDGPSAGVALTLAIISALTKKKISNKIAFTGEITLRGKILAIGGLKEKSIGAYKNNVKKIYFPYDNIADLEDIPKEVKDSIKFIGIKNFEEVGRDLI